MGVFDLFAKDKRSERTRAKHLAKAVDKFAQSVDRMRALEALAADGSDEALYGLLRRFGVKYDKTIDDEQEKEWVCDALCAAGAKALPAVKKYLAAASSVSWPLRVLEKVAADRDQELAAIEEVLARHEPGYERDPTKKIQLLSHLGLLRHPRSGPLAVPYLKDMDEGVRYAAIETLLRHKDEATAREPLLDLLTGEESLRLRRKIAEGFADLGWKAADRRAAVEPRLPEGFSLDKAGAFVRKTT